jgi:ribosomal protein L40E
VTLPNLWDKTPEAPSSSELNPLTNPVLEQHLGRWAKVYFGTPPAKREQAVSNLLEEIKRESGGGVAAQSGRPYFATDPKFATDPSFQRTVCASCRHQNPPGHKFCSRCGQVLSPGQPGSTENLGTTPGIPEAVPPNSATDMQWLGEHAFSSLNDSNSSQGRGWKYLAGAVVIVLAGLAYRHWAPEFRTRVASTANPPQVTTPAAALPPGDSSADAKAPQKAVAPESVVPEPKKEGTQNPSVTADAHDRALVPPGVQKATQRSTLLNAPAAQSTVSVAEGSSPDLRLAQRYLGGSMGVRDPSEAAKLLWRAVGKKNSTAAILLSDLYMRGDGVPRNCDQARLLLVAAAKRGSPQAAQQLRNLESQGCQ